VDIVKIILFTYLFYIGFALSVSIYRTWVAGELNVFNKILFAPILITFIIIDVIINCTILLWLFGYAPKWTWTITDRFEMYRRGDYGFKTALANLVCEKLLNTVDPSGRHC
jgi:hypothetical protein